LNITLAASILVLIIPSLIIAGCSEPGREDGIDVTFTLMIDSVESRDQDNVTVWDVSIIIDNIEPYDMDYKWLFITIVISGDSISDLPASSVTEYDNKPTRFCNIGYWYDDWSGDPSTADPTDILVLTSLTEEHQGAVAGIRYKGDRSGWTYLPDDFSTS